MGSVQSTLFHVFSGAYELKTSAVKKTIGKIAITSSPDFA